MRIAFITPEFITEYRDGGGLGNFLNRIGKLLAEGGHQVEVFVSSSTKPSVVDHFGIRVERVSPWGTRLWTKFAGRAIGNSAMRYPFFLYRQAAALAGAMERRHREAPFDLVQSADCMAVGLRVRSNRARVHIVRCSTAADLYNEIDGRNSWDEKCRERLERWSMRRAGKVYAPSRFVAEHFRNQHGIPVDVLRPPVVLEVAPAKDKPCGLPERFLVHFGRLTRRKGTI
jgi:hypothetical protein